MNMKQTMTDAVVSFLWADAAANEVLMESDGSEPSSFVAGFKPMAFSDGWGIVTPTSDHVCLGMCRALRVEGGSWRWRRRGGDREVARRPPSCPDGHRALAAAAWAIGNPQMLHWRRSQAHQAGKRRGGYACSRTCCSRHGGRVSARVG